jgi:3-deoxy-D-manno-octulosonic-acid transferase
MRKIARFFTQNEETNELLKGIGCDHVLCVGDTRYDMVLSRKSTRISDVKLDNFMKGRRAIILGSSWEKEELILKTSLKFLRNETIIIAPHEVTELSIGRIKKLFPEAICYTEGNLDSSKNILILDTIGQLANAYAHGFMAFIGGGFHGGLHNILEPAVYGLPVCFGPKHTKFPEAKAFITHGFSQEIHSAEDLINFINSTKSNQDKKQEEISAYVQRQQGAALKIVNQFS